MKKYTIEELDGDKYVISCETEQEKDLFLQAITQKEYKVDAGFREEWNIKTKYCNIDKNFFEFPECRNTFLVSDNKILNYFGKEFYTIIPFEQINLGKVNIKDAIKNKMAVHCKTGKQARKLLTYLNKLGWEWYDGGKINPNETYFNVHKNNTCYNLNQNRFGSDKKEVFEDIKHNVIEFNDLIFEKTPKRYFSELKNFNNHEWVRFYENENSHPNVQWAEGCHDVGIDGLKNFEKRVKEKYGEDKNNIIYRTYMLESDKMRLALGLSAREIGNIIMFRNFKELIYKKMEQINIWIKNADRTNDYFSKNLMWLVQTTKTNKFKYLKGNHDTNKNKNMYYDLVTLNYLDHNFAIPVPVLAKILQVERITIFNCFKEHLNRDEEEFI